MDKKNIAKFLKRFINKYYFFLMYKKILLYFLVIRSKFETILINF